jgi:hypothetical protein
MTRHIRELHGAISSTRVRRQEGLREKSNKSAAFETLENPGQGEIQGTLSAADIFVDLLFSAARRCAQFRAKFWLGLRTSASQAGDLDKTKIAPELR